MTPSAMRAIDSIIAKLASVRFGVTLLTITGIVCIVGTLMDYDTAIALIFNTWWFLSLLAFTSLSILCATWLTLTQTIPNDRKPGFITKPEDIALLQAHLEIQHPIQPTELADYLRRRKYKIFTKGNALCAIAGNAQRWGAVVTHLGLVILFIGAAIQITRGFSGTLTLREGQSTDSFFLAGTEKPVPLGFNLRLLDFEMKHHPNSNVPSQFTSTVQVDERNPAIIEVNRSYKYHGLVLHQNSYNLLPDVSRYILQIRRSTADLAFSEMNVGEDIDLENGRYRLSLFYKNDGIHYEIWPNSKGLESPRAIDKGIIASPPNYTLELLDFLPDFQLGDNMRPYSATMELHNPAIRVLIREGYNEVSASWLFLRPELRGFSHKALPLKMTFMGIASQKSSNSTTVPHLEDMMATVQIMNPGPEEPFTTVTLMQGVPVAVFQQTHNVMGDKIASQTAMSLQKWVKKTERINAYSSTLGVTHSPGIPWIYCGCALLTIGPIFSFSISRRKIWAIFEEDKTWIGGRARISNEALLKEISEFAAKSDTKDMPK